MEDKATADVVACCVRGDSVKPAAVIVLGLFVAGATTLVYLTGLTVGLRRSYTRQLRTLGLTRGSAGLYTRAAKLLNRLAALTDMDGMLAGDSLSPETRRQVTAWLDDYRREISK